MFSSQIPVVHYDRPELPRNMSTFQSSDGMCRATPKSEEKGEMQLEAKENFLFGLERKLETPQTFSLPRG